MLSEDNTCGAFARAEKHELALETFTFSRKKNDGLNKESYFAIDTIVTELFVLERVENKFQCIKIIKIVIVYILVFREYDFL